MGESVGCVPRQGALAEDTHTYRGHAYTHTVGTCKHGGCIWWHMQAWWMHKEGTYKHGGCIWWHMQAWWMHKEGTCKHGGCIWWHMQAWWMHMVDA